MPQPRDKRAKTRPMPLDQLPDYTEWAKKAKMPSPDDHGEMPPPAPEDQKEPREHGSRDKQERPA